MVLMSRAWFWAIGIGLIVVAMSFGGCTRSDDSAAPSSSSTPSATISIPTVAPTSASTATCTADHLRVALADDAGGGAAGSTYSDLTFTNTGATSCAMTGWPGVSYVGSGDGTQVGAAAERTGRATVIVVRPGARAEAQLREAQAGDYGDDCSITTVDGLRVYPPNSRHADFVAQKTHGCKAGRIHLLTISPVRLA